MNDIAMYLGYAVLVVVGLYVLLFLFLLPIAWKFDEQGLFWKIKCLLRKAQEK